MSMSLFARHASGFRPARRNRWVSWAVLAWSVAVLLILAALACTSGGGPAPAATTAAAATTSSAGLVQANGGTQSAGATLTNQTIIGEGAAATTATSTDGTLQNRSGFDPAATSTGL